MSEPALTFTAPLWLHHLGSWMFVTVPEDLGDDIRMLSGPPRGFGSVRVEVTLGATTWRTSVFPGTEGYVLPMKKAVRKAEEVDDGDTVEISLRVVEP